MVTVIDEAALAHNSLRGYSHIYYTAIACALPHPLDSKSISVAFSQHGRLVDSAIGNLSSDCCSMGMTIADPANHDSGPGDYQPAFSLSSRNIENAVEAQKQ